MRPLVLLLSLVSGCAPEPGPWTDEELAHLRSLSTLPPIPPSRSNPYADDPGAARLGRALFFDRQLSADGRIACADCHQPERAFTDGRPVAIGQGRTDRNSPTLLGAAYQTFFGWDGRWDSLWSQALSPLEDPLEHGTTRAAVAFHVHTTHRPAFEEVFGPFPPLPPLPDARPLPGDPEHPHHQAWLSLEPEVRATIDQIFLRVGFALEAWQRTLIPGPAPFDRYVQALNTGDPHGGGHLSESAIRGLRQFLGPGQCVHCHSGPLLTDRAFHVLGLPQPTADRSEGAQALLSSPVRCGQTEASPTPCPELDALDPALPAFEGATRTPTLRNVSRTAPYMHTGRLRDLVEVLDFYRDLPGRPARGERDHLLNLIDPAIDPFDLADFLHSLSSDPAPTPAVSPFLRDD